MSQPGQLHLNELEVAILERIASDNPDSGDKIRRFISSAQVLSRKFTGVGCYTDMLNNGVLSGAKRTILSLSASIKVPDPPNGNGAVMFCSPNEPYVLEICTYGDEKWDGRTESFSIA